MGAKLASSMGAYQGEGARSVMVAGGSGDFSNTATGSGTGYKYVTFNSSGSLTVTVAG